MKPFAILSLSAALTYGLITSSLATETCQAKEITGSYLEVRSCDVYTGPCFSNAEVGLEGREAMLVWTIAEGSWKATDLAGLSVIAVVRTRDTLGDIKYEEPHGDAVLILDKRADDAQRAALSCFAKSAASKLIGRVVNTHTAEIEANLGNCQKEGTCAEVRADDLVAITTRCLCAGDHLCGNEYLYYPPLTKIQNAVAAFTEIFSYQGDELALKWASSGLRSAYLGAFSL